MRKFQVRVKAPGVPDRKRHNFKGDRTLANRNHAPDDCLSMTFPTTSLGGTLLGPHRGMSVFARETRVNIASARN